MTGQPPVALDDLAGLRFHFGCWSESTVDLGRIAFLGIALGWKLLFYY